MDSRETQAKKSDDPSGSFQLDRVEIAQSGETHIVPPGKFRGQVEDLVLEPGLASLQLWFKTDEGDLSNGKVTIVNEAGAKWPQELDSKGHVVFLLELTLDGQDWRFEPYKLKVGEQEREFSLLAIYRFPSGNVTGMMNTPSEMGAPPSPDQPQTVDFEVDHTFVKAFADFCGFAVEDVAKVRLEPNDRQRFQVAWTGSNFVQSRHVIAIGQPIWVAISAQGDRCYINPPCGNPEVPKGKLPPAPPELQPAPTQAVETPTSVVEEPIVTSIPIVVIGTPKPQATVLPIVTKTVTRTPRPTTTLPPGVTRTPTKTTIPPTNTRTRTPTPVTPSATAIKTPTPVTPSATAIKTPTPVTPSATAIKTPTPAPTITITPTSRPSPPLVTFSGFVQHGDELCEWRGVFTASQDVFWSVIGGTIVNQSLRVLTVDVQSSVGRSDSVTITAINVNGSNSRTEWTPVCAPAPTPGASRTPLPTWTPNPLATPWPTPISTPIPP